MASSGPSVTCLPATRYSARPAKSLGVRVRLADQSVEPTLLPDTGTLAVGLGAEAAALAEATAAPQQHRLPALLSPPEVSALQTYRQMRRLRRLRHQQRWQLHSNNIGASNSDASSSGLASLGAVALEAAAAASTVRPAFLQ